MNPLPTQSLRFGLAAVTLLAIPVHAELIKLKGKETIACRVIETTDLETRVITSKSGERRELVIPNQSIVKRIHGSEEIASIETNRNAASLSDWAASYYHASLEMLAKRCIRGALALKPQLGAKPRTLAAGAGRKVGEFVNFWNRIVLQARADAAKTRDVTEHMAVAKWAKEAGLNEDAAYYLRKAWSMAPDSVEAGRLAVDWGVSLERWLQVDLTTALDQPLLKESIQDGQDQVTAEAEKEFIVIPLRYAPTLFAAEMNKSSSTTLARNSLKGKSGRGYYGLRFISSEANRLNVDGTDQNPIYERMAIKPREGRDRMIELRDHLGPRVPAQAEGDGQKTNRPPKQPRLRSRPITKVATGWIGLVLEVPRQSNTLKLEWARGGEDLLDLAFVRRCQSSSPEVVRTPAANGDSANTIGGWASNQGIRSALTHVGGASPSMAALAIEWLLRIRLELEVRSGEEADADLEDFASAVDGAIIRAGARSEEQVRVSAWRYFSTHAARSRMTPSAQSMRELRRGPVELQRNWNRIVLCALVEGPCGMWWESPSPIQHVKAPEAGDDRLTAVQICAASFSEALLGSNDVLVCAEAMDRLMGLPTAATDWRFLKEASLASQRLALERIHDLPDPASQRRLIQALVLSAAPELAHDLSEAAREIEMHAGQTGAELLRQWDSLSQAEQKVAFLSSLGGLSLGNSIYGPRFNDMISQAVREDRAIREAAWRLCINQLRFRKENLGAEYFTSRGAASRASHLMGHGPFPMLLDSESNDPLIRVAADAVQRGSSDLSYAAARALIELGYADEIVRALLSDQIEPEKRKARLERMLADSEINRTDAFVAMMSGLLKPGAADCSLSILNHLRELLLTMPPEDMWRFRLAIKAGADFEAMDELGQRLDPTGANSVNRLMRLTGHFTQQDVQRLRKASGTTARSEALAEINLRGGCRVDGDYKALAIISTTSQIQLTAEERSSDKSRALRWSHPQRVTLVMPPVRLRSAEFDDTYEVYWGPKSIGQGRVLEVSLPVRASRAYYPLLRSNLEWWSVSGTNPEEESGSGPPVFGPPRFQSRKVLKTQSAGTMTLQIGEYLSRGIRDARVFPAAELDDLVPPSLSITLRSCVFSSYAGTTVTIQPGMTPAKEGDVPQVKPNPGPRHLSNILLIFERDTGEN